MDRRPVTPHNRDAALSRLGRKRKKRIMTLTRRCLTLAGLAAAATGLAISSPLAASAASGATATPVQLKVLTLRLASDPSQLANVQGASLADGAPVIQYPWSGTANERWLATVEDDGYYRFASLGSNKCLNVAGGGTSDGAAVIQYTCSTNGAPNERWQFVQTGIGYQIVAKSSGKCLNVAGGVGVGRQLIQYTCTPGGSPNDVWLPVWEPTNP
jgi:hypothetical protein